MLGSPQLSYHLEAVPFFTFPKLLMTRLNKFSICVAKSLATLLKVVTVVLQNYMNFQCHTESMIVM